MRHGKKNNHLGRTASHRKSLLSNLANSLILNKRIVTTLAKAKELRKYVEPILTKSKDDSTHNRRTVFSYLKNKESIKTLFGEVSEKIANRNGGYTRIIKLGTRSGDAAETAMIELVDYNEILLAATAEKPAKTRRSRRSSGKPAGSGSSETQISDVVAASQTVDSVSQEAPAAEAENIQHEDASPSAATTDVESLASENAPAEETMEESSSTDEIPSNLNPEKSDEPESETPSEGTAAEDESKPEA